jgi:peptide/nickel transport system ATP-binding protein
MAPAPLLAVRDLTVELDSGQPVVSGVSMTLEAGQTLGLVGESGSGKTTVALALLGYARPGMRIVSGEVEIAGQRIALQDETAARAMRGRLVSHVPQDPNTNLNPSLRIGRAINDVVLEHRREQAGEETVHEALRRVHLPATRSFARRYPHQLSGGQKQRVLIASALVCEPPLIVFDEPTTGLDVVTQARILEEVERLHRERQIAMIYVSHDIAVVSQVANQVAVLYGGIVVEHGSTERVLSRPRHPYTRGLVSSVPDHTQPRRMRGIPGVAVGIDERPAGCPFAPRCEQRVERCTTELPPLEPLDGRDVRCFEAQRTPPPALDELRSPPSTDTREALLSVEHLTAVHRDGRHTVVAASDVSFEVQRGAAVALVGESGSGKTTIARVIAGLHQPSGGRITLGGAELAARAQKRPRELRRRCQIIFQDPYESLNPRRRIVDEIARPARLLRGLSRAEARAEVAALLEQVRLPARLAEHYPGELSGGERQRVAIARALAAQPELLVCDEITSALDVSVQAAVVELLAELRSRLSLSLLFITHNLGVVAAIADYVLILDQGVICEEGPVERVFSQPQSPRAIELLEAAPTLRVAA